MRDARLEAHPVVPNVEPKLFGPEASGFAVPREKGCRLRFRFLEKTPTSVPREELVELYFALGSRAAKEDRTCV